MWNFFNREIFPYCVEDEIPFFRDYSIFSLNNGTKKTTGEKVSIFIFNKTSEQKLELSSHALTAIRKLKKFKHPSILTYLDSHEDENSIYLVTNRCMPLFSYLANTDKLGDVYLKWGLASISEAVAFLNSVKLRHNNIFHGSVFVSEQGTWQLGEFGYVTGMDWDYPSKLVGILYKYLPSKCSLRSVLDDWGLGVLLWEIFNGELDSIESLCMTDKIPDDLQPVFHQLTAQSRAEENGVSKLIDCCQSDNLLTNALDCLCNFHTKDKAGKSKAIKETLQLMTIIPKEVLIFKVLILLKQIYEYDDENGALIVPVVAKISSLASEEEFHLHVERFVISLMASNDRATRLTLLLNIKDLVEKIEKKNLNNMYNLLSAGFLDTNPQLRDETVKAMVHIAPKLSKNILNQEVLRQLVHLQMKDVEPCIRTNSTICMGNIAFALSPNVRQKVLLSAFLNALNDPSHAVRSAAVRAFAFTHRFYSTEVTARSILPKLMCLTVDPEVSVRQIVFTTVKTLMQKLEDVSHNPLLKSEIEKEVTCDTCEEDMSWTQWAFAALTGKLLKVGEGKSGTKENSVQKSLPGTPSTMRPSLANRTEENNEPKTEEELRCIPIENNYSEIGTENHTNIPVRKRSTPMKLGKRLK